MSTDKTTDLHLGKGLVSLLTRKDAAFFKWAEEVILDEILAPVKSRLATPEEPK